MKKTLRAVMVMVVLAAAAMVSACIIAGEASSNEAEPNDSSSQATILGTLGSTTVYARLSDSDRTDYFHFSKGNEPVVEFDIVAMDSDLEYDLSYSLALTGGSTITSGSSAEYEIVLGQAANHNYDLKVTLDSYGSGGRYAVLIRCRY
jgi:hypothetical protein